MIVWVIIIVSILFAYMGYKKGLYTMFATVFNLMFATFVSILSTPKLMSFSGEYQDSGYYGAASILLLFILVFGILQFIAYMYFLRNSEGLFPKLFDKLGAAVLGCLSGYVICSVLLLIFCVMPFSAQAADYHLGSREHLESLSVPGVDKVCNFLAWYSLHCFEGDSERAIEQLLALGEEKPAEDSDEIDDNGALLLPGALSQTP